MPAGNYMARQLGHHVDFAGAWSEWSPVDRLVALGGSAAHDKPLQAWFDASPLGVSDEEHLARALHNLDAIDVVGTTERLADVVAAVTPAFGFATAPVERFNVASNAAHDLSDRVRRRLDEITQIDRALYDRARERTRELTD
jgi:hypothetical protein